MYGNLLILARVWSLLLVEKQEKEDVDQLAGTAAGPSDGAGHAADSDSDFAETSYEHSNSVNDDTIAVVTGRAYES